MDLSCSFKDPISSKICGKGRTSDDRVIPVSQCQRNILNHLLKYNLSKENIQTEGDLLRLRGGFFDEANVSICPVHRAEFGTQWRRSLFCMVKAECQKRDSKRPYKALTNTSLSIEQSKFLFKNDDTLIPVGSGICGKCRTELLKRMEASKESTMAQNMCSVEIDPEKGTYHMEDAGSEQSDQAQNMCSVEIDPEKGTYHMEDAGSEQSDQEQAHMNCGELDELSMSETISDLSQYSEWQDSQESPGRKRKAALNDFLAAVDISPIKKTLVVDFDLASERTKHDYIKKAKQIMHSVLQILVPEQEGKLENMLYSVPDIDKMLDSISSAYRNIASWGAQRQLLSLLVQDYSYSDLKKHIPELTHYKYSAARKHAATYGVATPVPDKKQVREKVSKEQLEHFLDFIMSPAIMTDAPFGECTYKISSGETLHVPRIILNSVRTRTVTLYMKYCQETDYCETLSERTYMRLLEAIAPSVRKSMRGIDNFSADGCQAFENLKTVVMTIGQTGKGKDWTDKVNDKLTRGKQYLKLHYKLHVSTDSEVPDHCCRFGLSSKEKNYTSKCEHSHHLKCDDCEMLSETLNTIEEAIDTITFPNSDEKDDAKYVISQSIRTIIEWKKHIMRTMNQERARKKILDFLQPNEALIERDWAMKFLPLQYRESQSSWFAKRGLSWHVSVITFKDTEDTRSLTVVHVFDTATQDAVTSNAILKDLFRHVHLMNSDINTLYIRSDNAGCFHSSYSIMSIPELNNNDYNISIRRMDFCDPQAGKSICDRKAAHIKSCIKRYVNEGHNVQTAADFKAAIECTMTNLKVVVALPPNSVKMSNIPKGGKIENISLLHNFFFDSKTIIAWKQFEIGTGKEFTANSIQSTTASACIKVREESSISWQTQNRNTVHVHVTETVSNINTENVENIESDQQGENLFTCPEEGCILTFMRYGQLCLHLDRGNHVFPSNSLNLRERTQKRYASLVESKISSQKTLEYKNASCMLDVSVLNQGWALKCNREVKRFSSQQISFLTQKFNFGESTGFKCDPEEVAKEMRQVKNSDGTRLFRFQDFLTPSQIGSFFSRLSLKKRKESNTNFDENDLSAEECNNVVSQLADFASSVL